EINRIARKNEGQHFSEGGRDVVIDAFVDVWRDIGRAGWIDQHDQVYVDVPLLQGLGDVQTVIGAVAVAGEHERAVVAGADALDGDQAGELLDVGAAHDGSGNARGMQLVGQIVEAERKDVCQAEDAINLHVAAERTGRRGRDARRRRLVDGTSDGEQDQNRPAAKGTPHRVNSLHFASTLARSSARGARAGILVAG